MYSHAASSDDIELDYDDMDYLRALWFYMNTNKWSSMKPNPSLPMLLYLADFLFVLKCKYVNCKIE